MPAGFYMNFDLVYGSATASTAIAAAKTAYPVSFPRIFALVNQPEPDTPWTLRPEVYCFLSMLGIQVPKTAKNSRLVV
jgi:hypothetical protein